MWAVVGSNWRKESEAFNKINLGSGTATRKRPVPWHTENEVQHAKQFYRLGSNMPPLQKTFHRPNTQTSQDILLAVVRYERSGIGQLHHASCALLGEG